MDSHSSRHSSSSRRTKDDSRSRNSRSRSRSPERSHKKSKSSKSRYDDSDEDDHRSKKDNRPEGIKDIDEEDYFLKSVELKVWLNEEKGKRLDSISGDTARGYFKKFVKSWNKGKLDSKYYAGIAASSISASASSSHSWKFSGASERELDDSSSIRKSIDSTGNNSIASSSSKPMMGPMMGPSRPSSNQSAVETLQSERESEEMRRKSIKNGISSDRSRSNRNDREEERADRSTGRERIMEKKREAGADKREYDSSRESGGMQEISDDVLMGGSQSSWKAMVDARDGINKNGQLNKRARAAEERQAVMTDRGREAKAKEAKTMDMFKMLAQKYEK